VVFAKDDNDAACCFDKLTERRFAALPLPPQEGYAQASSKPC